jgi:hypothetical protein
MEAKCGREVDDDHRTFQQYRSACVDAIHIYDRRGSDQGKGRTGYASAVGLTGRWPICINHRTHAATHRGAC